MPPPEAPARTKAVVSAMIAVLIAVALSAPLIWTQRRASARMTYGAPKEVYDIRWSNKPTAEEIAWAYPAKARSLKMLKDPEADLKCRITDIGALDQCFVSLEDPPGYGFGAAALSLQPRYRLYPYDLNGGSLVGRPVTVLIVFPQPKPPTN